MTVHLADTSGLFAVLVDRDAHHRPARELWQTRGNHFHIPAVVLGETYTLLRSRRQYGLARPALRNLQSSRIVTIHEMTAALDTAAWAVIDEFAGVPLSYADASLVALGRQLGVETVFSFDDDLRQAGLQLVPEQPSGLRLRETALAWEGEGRGG